MEKNMYDYLKDQQDFQELYLNYKKTLKGFKSFLKGIIEAFVSDYDIYLDKPYLDVSYIKIKDKIIDLDLFYDIFKESLREGY